MFFLSSTVYFDLPFFLFSSLCSRRGPLFVTAIVFTGLAGILVELESARTSGEEPNKWKLGISGVILTFGVIAMIAGMIQIIMQHVAAASST